MLSLLSFTQKKMDMQFSEAECLKIDAAHRKVYCRSNISNNLNEKEEFVVDYDYLIIAVGANVNTFNTPGVMENCHFLKVTSFIILFIMLSCIYRVLYFFKKAMFFIQLRNSKASRRGQIE